MSIVRKKYFWVLVGPLLVCLLFGFNVLYKELVGDFHLENITYNLPNNLLEETPFLSAVELQDVKKIFDQQFNYLGEGKQTYAFVSKDGRYVLKFFKFGHLKPSFISKIFPSIGPIEQYKNALERSQQRKLEEVFAGYKLAYNTNRENSSLIFLHLNSTKNLLEKAATVFDKIGNTHQIDLDQVVFVLQNKGEKTKKVLMDLLDRQDITAVKTHMSALFDLYLSEYQKGIYDRDHNLMHNTGFIGSKAFRLDVGRMQRKEFMRDPVFAKKDLENIAWKRIDPWMKKYYPQYRLEISQYMQEKLSQLF